MSRVSFGGKLTAILVLALTLRLGGTEWGRPYAYHFDEPFVLKPALRMVANGDPNPHFFRYPSLLIYLEAAVVAAKNAFADMPLREPAGPGYGPQDLYPETWPALLGGRRLVAVLGTLGVLAASLVARATGGASAALLAALLISLCPLHVEHSHYLTTDVPTATCVTLAVAAALNLSSRSGALLAGCMAGLATSFKYTGAAIVPLLAVLTCVDTNDWRSRSKRTALLVTAAVATFAVTTPFAWLDLRAFLDDLAIVRSHYTGGHLGAEGSANWGWYLTRLRQDGLGDLGLMFVVSGAVLSCIDALGRFHRSRAGAVPAQRRVWPVVALLLAALAWFGWLGSVRVRFERNLLPALTLACIVAGHGWAALLDAARHRDRRLACVVVAVCAVILVGPADVSRRIVDKLRAADTRNLAAQWIDAHVPPGSSIVREEYTPQPDTGRFDVRYVWSLAGNEVSDYTRLRIDYLVASRAVYGRVLNSGQPEVEAMAQRYRAMFLYPRAATFEPGPGVSGPTIEILEVPRAAAAD